MKKKIVNVIFWGIFIIFIFVLVNSTNNITDSQCIAKDPDIFDLKRGNRSNKSLRDDDNVYLTKFCTYLGGSNTELIENVVDLGMDDAVVDNDGNIIVTGRTASYNFPTLNAYQSSKKGGTDVFIAKLNQTGELIFSTFLGGNNDDWGTTVAVDGINNIYVVGTTQSSDFPTLNAYNSDHMGGTYYSSDIFFAKFSSNGALIFSSYFGGSEDDWGYGINTDTQGNFILTGSTYSSDLPTSTNALQTSISGSGVDAYLSKFSSDGQELLISTLLGSDGHDWGIEIAFDSIDNIIMVGGSSSLDFPTVNSYQNTMKGVIDPIILKLSHDGQELLYSTYFGGSGDDRGLALDIDSNDNVVITGYTPTSDFPTKNALRNFGGGDNDAYIAKLNSTGELIFSTFFGGNNDDRGYDVALDENNDIYITGQTRSINFPTTENATFSTYLGIRDAYITKITNDGQVLSFSSYFGGSDDDRGKNILVDSSGNLFLTGISHSTDIPVSGSSYQDKIGGNYDIFIASMYCQSSSTQTTTTTPITTSESSSTVTSTTSNASPGYGILCVLFSLGLILIKKFRLH